MLIYKNIRVIKNHKETMVKTVNFPPICHPSEETEQYNIINHTTQSILIPTFLTHRSFRTQSLKYKKIAHIALVYFPRVYP